MQLIDTLDFNKIQFLSKVLTHLLIVKLLNPLKSIPLLVLIISFASIPITSANAQEIPIKIQWKMGTLIDELTCKPDFQMIIKKTDGSPACVKETSVAKLFDRNWATDSPVQPPEEINFPQTPETSIPEGLDVVSANNQFAMNFYSQIAKDDGNIFFSPFSISTAFAIAYEGARETTAEQIQKTFGFPPEYETRTSQFQNTIDELNPEGAPYQLSVANALWLAEGFQPKPEYVDTAANYYDGEVSTVDFVSDDGVDKINSWVAEKTNEKIKDILQKGSTGQDTRLYITNAIYFKGNWVKQFNATLTQDEPFWITPSENIQAPMMSQKSILMNYTETENLQVLKMPYDGNRLSMIVLLPKEKDGLSFLEGSLDKLDTWKSLLAPSKIHLYIPKFKMETEYKLKGSLSEMGMPIAFSESDADFGGIASNLYISDARHKAYVDVNEEGTEAAAVTAIGIMTSSVQPPIPTFRADHPFVFLIQDDNTGNILFMGRVMDPTK